MLSSISCCDDVNETLAQRGLRVELSDEAKDWLLAQAGVEPSTGARPLRRTIQRHIQDAISEILISHPGDGGGLIDVTVAGGELHLQLQEPQSIGKEN